MTATPTNGVNRGQGKRKPLMLATTESVSIPEPPKHLKAHGRGWRESIWRGGARWLDPVSDHLIDELVCTTLDLIDEIEANLNANGRYYETKIVQQLPRTGVADCRALRAQVVSWLSLLAFSPSQRAELGAGIEVNDFLNQWRLRNVQIKSP
jgi:hypothetical protein